MEGSSGEVDADATLRPAVFSGGTCGGVDLFVSDGGLGVLLVLIPMGGVGDGSSLALRLDVLRRIGGRASALRVLRRLREEERIWSNEIESLAFSMSLSRPRF